MYAELTSSLSCGPPHIWKRCSTRIVYIDVVEWSSHLWPIQFWIALIVFPAFNFIDTYSIITCIKLLRIALFVGECIKLLSLH